MSTHTFPELVENFRNRAKKEDRNAREARIRAEVWEEAATWVSIVCDRTGLTPPAEDEESEDVEDEVEDEVEGEGSDG